MDLSVSPSFPTLPISMRLMTSVMIPPATLTPTHENPAQIFVTAAVCSAEVFASVPLPVFAKLELSEMTSSLKQLGLKSFRAAPAKASEGKDSCKVAPLIMNNEGFETEFEGVPAQK